MSQAGDKKNRQMELMLAPAQDRLKKYSTEDLCKKGKIRFNENTGMFEFNSMNQLIQVSYPDFVIRQDLEMWHYLTLLQYMDTADATPLTGDFIGLAQMRGGLSRGRGYDQDISAMFANEFVNVAAEDFEAACRSLGGEILETKADVTAVIHYAPMFPVLVNFYEGDDEFLPSGKTLVDKNAEHYLELEAAGGACSSVVALIRKKLR